MSSGNGTKMYTVDKFLGINESGDGDTELKMGEASKMENFYITDAYNLTLRPGVRRVDFAQQRDPAHILGVWAGFIRTRELLVICDFAGGKDRLFVYNSSGDLVCRKDGVLGLQAAENAMVSIFTFNGELYVMSAGNTVIFTDEEDFVTTEPYIPLVVVGADPTGGGETLEALNMLTGKRRINYSADGSAKAYTLPEEALSITAITIDNVAQNVQSAGTFNTQTHTFTFNTAPVKGVGNVEITYDTDAAAAEVNRKEIISCPLHEEYNGSTDTRLFVAGNGSNRCYYTGMTLDGVATAMYFPAMNEVAVDMSGSSITGMIRHYSKLLVFKADGTYTISYEPVTMEDGSTVAGFYLRPMNREFGNEALGQVQTVNNYPRTISKAGIYEWRITSSYYKDERYASRISDMVKQTIRQMDTTKVVTCDDGFSKTYYVFLNDEKGTVLVNRYDLTKEGVWCIYRGNLFRNVRYALMMGGRMLFVNDTEAFVLDSSVTRDAAQVAGGEAQQIKAAWESGFMDFGADFKRKYSSTIYLSVRPQANSEIIVTAQTDKRADYMEKTIENNVANWPNLNFVDWTFNTNDRPTIDRVRLKVKKFVYYKLIFRIEKDGAQGTILGFDQQVRFASMAK